MIEQGWIKGTQLTPTSLAIQSHVLKAGDRALAIGFSRDPQCIRVTVNGKKTPHCMHRSFLQLAVSRPASAGGGQK